MNKRVISASLALVACALVMSSAALAQGLEFPEVPGWEKGEKTTYPTSDLGYSVPYRSETAGVVTVYVYNGGFKSIADGIADENVKAEIKKAESDIKAYGDAGYYKDVKLVKSDTIKIDGTRPVLYSLFSFSLQGTDVDSEIYLFGHKNNFVKLRCTRPKGANGPQNAELDKLLKAVVAIFR